MIKITIAGPVASGKTTLALAFATFLHEQGFFDVDVDDTGIGVGSSYEHLQDDRLRAIHDQSIVIETIQVQSRGDACMAV